MNNAEIISAIATVEEKYQKGDIDKQAFEDTIDSLQLELGDKLDAMAWIIQDTQKDLAVYETEKKRLKDVQGHMRTAKKRIKNLKHYMASLVDQSGAKKIRTEEHIFSARNYAAPLEIDDESQIPEEYFKVTYDVDNTKIRDALKEGKEVPGVHLGTNRQITIK